MLPCLAVGVPQPTIMWRIKGIAFATNDHIRQQPDGSLFIRDVTRTDAGEYSCHVENSFGQDSVTHQLIVNSPPRSPQVGDITVIIYKCCTMAPENIFSMNSFKLSIN